MIVFVLAVIVLILLLFLLLSLVHSIVAIILFLAVAGLCAAVAEYVLGMREGVLRTILIGLVGAAVGVILRELLHLPAWVSIEGLPIVWTVLGSLIVVLIVRLATGGRRGRPHWV
jgi:uncharacterized membrane protein YeaQ/YmgE (transglycosylase-associated protein family)